MVVDGSSQLDAVKVHPNGSQQSKRAWRLLATPLLVLSACGAAEGPDQGRKKTAQPATASNYSIAGIMPGMTAQQVAGLAANAGYRISHTSAGPDWQLTQQMAASGRKFDLSSKHRGVSAHELRKGGELLQVAYMPMPKGSVVKSVSYSASAAVVSYELALAELTRRYGKPSFSNATAQPWAQWCSRPARTARECLKHKFLNVESKRDGVSMHLEDASLLEQQKAMLAGSSGQRASF
jgi:hypothetical protein